MRDPAWMSGDDPEDCYECGYQHDVDDECIGDDPDQLHDELGEE